MYKTLTLMKPLSDIDLGAQFIVIRLDWLPHDSLSVYQVDQCLLHALSACKWGQ
jgi:hypothetical protein